jgi:CheY-like chemotaxis protein
MEVCLNLIRNAMEAMDHGGVLAVRSGQDKGQAFLSLGDTGPGMDQQTLQRVFEPFFTTKGVRGQGLGLPSSRGMIRSHGGDIEVASAPGQGARFTVWLGPWQDLPSPEEAAPGADRPPSGLKVLLVEDEALVAMGIATTLRKAGHQVLHSSTLAQAVEDLPGFQPDLILCDLGLPDGAGWEVCARLHREAALAGLENIPLVVLSGWSSDQIQRQGDQSCQAAAYLQKPVESARLLQVLALAAPGRPREPQALN